VGSGVLVYVAVDVPTAVGVGELVNVQKLVGVAEGGIVGVLTLYDQERRFIHVQILLANGNYLSHYTPILKDARRSKH
jgi:hypothetical protein